MTNVDTTQDDPYLITPESHKAYMETQNGSSRPKVNWHNLPQGSASSIWRVLPYPQVRNFYLQVRKHFQIPGMKGSLLCPRSFDDPGTEGRKYFCAICDKFFDFKKSDDPAKKALSTLLRSNSAYLVNAVNMKETDKGVGVLTLPYQVFQTLDAWISTTGSPYLTFSHPKMGRNIIINSKIVQGTSFGKDNKEKRDYTVMPDASSSPLENMDWLDQLYDLKTVMGVPTTEFTQVCLERLIKGDESIALPEGAKAYRGQLTSGESTPPTDEGNEDPSFDTSSMANTTPSPVSFAPVEEQTAAPAFAQTPTTKSTGGLSEDDVRRQFEAILKKGAN